MTRSLFEVNHLPADGPGIPPQNPLVEAMFATEKFVRDSICQIQQPAQEDKKFDAVETLREISVSAKLEIPHLRNADAIPAKDFFEFVAQIIEINITRNFARIQALHAGHIPNPAKYETGNWQAVLIRWRFLYKVCEMIRSELLPALEKILKPPETKSAAK